MELEKDLVPVVQARTFQLFVPNREAQRLDQLELAAGDRAEPGDVSRVGRNLWGNQHQMKRLRGGLQHIPHATCCGVGCRGWQSRSSIRRGKKSSPPAARSPSLLLRVSSG